MGNRFFTLQEEFIVPKKVSAAQSKHVRNYMVPTGGKVGYNNVKIFINGEDAWAHVHQSILGAKKSIHLCFWMLDSNLELTRNLSSSLLDPPMRKHNTLIEILKKKKKKLLGTML